MGTGTGHALTAAALGRESRRLLLTDETKKKATLIFTLAGPHWIFSAEAFKLTRLFHWRGMKVQMFCNSIPCALPQSEIIQFSHRENKGSTKIAVLN